MQKILVLIVSLLLIAGCTQKALYNVEHQAISSHSSGAQPDLEQVEKAIVSACRKKTWIPRRVANGLIEASVFVRGHQAVVTIQFDQNSYSITHKSSANLNYRKRSNGNESIHRNYNRWVANLNRGIQTELSVLALGY